MGRAAAGAVGVAAGAGEGTGAGAGERITAGAAETAEAGSRQLTGSSREGSGWNGSRSAATKAASAALSPRSDGASLLADSNFRPSPNSHQAPEPDNLIIPPLASTSTREAVADGPLGFKSITRSLLPFGPDLTKYGKTPKTSNTRRWSPVGSVP